MNSLLQSSGELSYVSDPGLPDLMEGGLPQADNFFISWLL